MLFKGTICAITLVVGISSVWSATAAELPGAREPAFLAAADTWLDDNDEEACPLLHLWQATATLQLDCCWPA